MTERLAGNVPEPVRMQNCAETLLGQGQITELKLEYAIQVAEDWLMPLATVAKGSVLEVYDSVGRLRSELQLDQRVQQCSFSIEDIEFVFRRVVDSVVRRQALATTDLKAAVADMVMLRELAHHGQVTRIDVFRQRPGR